MSTPAFSGESNLQSHAETRAWAHRFASILQGNDVVALTGSLGAGKTFLTQSILSSLGCNEAVTSPTFALLNIHHAAGHAVYHWDFYRMKSADEPLEAGWLEFLAEDGAVHLIEWADRFPSLIPASAWWIALQAQDGENRKLTWTGPRPLPEL